MQYQAFLIKYAEIGTKGKNRYVFEDALVHDIRMKLKRATGSYSVSRERGRIYVNVKSEDYDYEECIDALRHVFGIAGIAPMVQVPLSPDFSVLENAVLSIEKEVNLYYERMSDIYDYQFFRSLG